MPSKLRYTSRLNNVIAIASIFFDVIFILLSLFIIAISIYFLVADWGELNKFFFIRWSIGGILFGIVVFSLSVLSGYGLYHQTDQLVIKNISWLNGRRVLAIYMLLLFGILALDIWVLITLTNTISSISNTKEALSSGISIDYDSFEEKLSSKFNEFFFAATESCSGAYNWFWNWVQNRCPVSLEEVPCKIASGCVNNPNSLQCAADKSVCYQNSVANYIQSCPYEICRQGALSFFVEIIRRCWSFVIAILTFHLAKVLITILLICYNKRDSFVDILVKNGTLKQHPKKSKAAE
jgi:hypothetical protein